MNSYKITITFHSKSEPRKLMGEEFPVQAASVVEAMPFVSERVSYFDSADQVVVNVQIKEESLPLKLAGLRWETRVEQEA